MYLNSKLVAIGTGDTLLSEKQSRNYVGIQNSDAGNFVVIKFNNAASDGSLAGSSPVAATLTNGIKLLAGEFYKIEGSFNGQIRAIADTAPVNVVINEGQ